MDYDARLKAYRRLSPDLWRGLVKSKTAQVLIYRAFLDLQSGDDLSLRHASSHALSNLLNCASLQKQFLANGDLEGESRKNSEIEIEGELQNLVMKLVLPSTKRGIGASNLAVRQVIKNKNIAGKKSRKWSRRFMPSTVVRLKYNT